MKRLLEEVRDLSLSTSSASEVTADFWGLTKYHGTCNLLLSIAYVRTPAATREATLLRIKDTLPAVGRCIRGLSEYSPCRILQRSDRPQEFLKTFLL